MKKLLPVIALMMACAPSEEKFEAENISLICEKAFECTPEEDREALDSIGLWFFGADVEECKTIYTEATSDVNIDTAITNDLVYDKQAAKDCLNELEALTCEEIGDGNITGPSCENVYTEAE